MGVRLFSLRSGEGLTGPRREAAAIALTTLALFVALALASLDFDSTSGREGNWVGPVGAAIAGFLVRGFGYVAWLLPLELLLLAVPLFGRRPLPPLAPRLAGDLALSIVLAALAYVAAPHSPYLPGVPAGGNVGLFFGELMRALFSTLGSFLVGATLIALLSMARSGFSFVEWFQRCSRLAVQLRGSALASLRHLRQAVTRARAQRSRRTEEADLSFVGAHAGAAPDRDDHCPASEGGEGWSASAATARLGSAARRLLGGAGPDDAGVAGEARHAKVLAGRSEPAGSKAVNSPPRESEEEGPPASAKRRPPPAVAETVAAAAEVRGGDSDGPRIVDTRHLGETLIAEREEVVVAAAGGYAPPGLDLLEPTPREVDPLDRERVRHLAQLLVETLENYGVIATVDEIHPGPTVTTYEVTPRPGTKVSKVAGLSDDLALGLSRQVRIIAPIPGKSRIGFELPNDVRSPMHLRELVEDKRFDELAERAPLPVVMGRDIVGAPFYADLSAMPHVIVAGATGAGKSVGLNVMLCSLLFKRSPDELRLLMVDPKVVELAPFDGIPHMLLPVVTDMKQAAKALKWAVDEMERRYQAFAAAGTKSLGTYNRWVDRVRSGDAPPPDEADLATLNATVGAMAPDPENLPTRLPHIVIVLDEFSDLMMQQGKEVEAAVARLAQKARAAGMHVVLATQRPSVDVITGMIKANFPTRVAYRVAQKVDSRTILDEQGAEVLLGRGDLLAKMNGSGQTCRVQCPFISEEEVRAVTDHLRLQGTPVYHDDILRGGEDEDENQDAEADVDPRFDEAVRLVADTQKCSTSWIQRKLKLGYNRAARIVEMMERQGIVGPPNGSKEREIWIHPQ